MKQDELLKIVERWNINPNPEYRGFRCAQCQEYITKAWHHWLFDGGYQTPVHFCQACEQEFEKGDIVPKATLRAADKTLFEENVRERAQEEIQRIVKNWAFTPEAIWKPFTCDRCQKEIEQAWHVWTAVEGILTETHFCKECGQELHLE